jgi:hypothetical protein
MENDDGVGASFLRDFAAHFLGEAQFEDAFCEAAWPTQQDKVLKGTVQRAGQ